MTAQTLSKPDVAPDTNAGKPAMHSMCAVCYPIPGPGHIAFCGYVTTGETKAFMFGPPAEWPLCVVCMDLVPQGCPKCGTGR